MAASAEGNSILGFIAPTVADPLDMVSLHTQMSGFTPWILAAVVVALDDLLEATTRWKLNLLHELPGRS